MVIDVAPFLIRGGLYPRSPVVIAVAHAGRCYPDALLDIARVPQEALRGLEDRHADALIESAVAEGATAIVATVARAAIDLNRDPREIDPGMIEAIDPGRALLQTQKMRGGLGLIPRRLALSGELWRRRLTEAELDSRIEEIHAPYHRAIADRLRAAHAIYGGAILIDCHSMPSLMTGRVGRPPRIVIGDRFGASADKAVIDAATAVVAADSVPQARNQPYAGGYALERHGRPSANIHAVQIEFDRALYLDGSLAPRPSGVAACGRLLAAMAAAMAAAMGRSLPIAAE